MAAGQPAQMDWLAVRAWILSLAGVAEGVADYVEASYREVRLGRSNHWVQQEYPSEVNAALLSFLEE